MTAAYDKYYQTPDLFGEAYPALLAFMAARPQKGNVLDLGCGQGRDAIPLARMGYSVTGVDSSKVGIEQMNAIGKAENLDLVGHVEDIYAFHGFDAFDIILLDSMFHFAQKDKKKEIALIQNIVAKIKKGGLLIVCIQDTGNKLAVLNQALDAEKKRKRIHDKTFIYTFDHRETKAPETKYRMIVVEK